MASDEERRMRRALVAVNPERFRSFDFHWSDGTNGHEARLHQGRPMFFLSKAVLTKPTGLVPAIGNPEMRYAARSRGESRLNHICELLQERNVSAHNLRASSFRGYAAIPIDISIDETLHAVPRIENDPREGLPHMVGVPAQPHPKQIRQIGRDYTYPETRDLALQKSRRSTYRFYLRHDAERSAETTREPLREIMVIHDQRDRPLPDRSIRAHRTDHVAELISNNRIETLSAQRARVSPLDRA